MKAAYAIPITVYQHRNNAQLDLGPLARRIEVRLDIGPDMFPVAITGTVRGNIQIGERGPDQDRINLGSFRHDRPTDKTVIVTTSQADLEVARNRTGRITSTSSSKKCRDEQASGNGNCTSRSMRTRFLVSCRQTRGLPRNCHQPAPGDSHPCCRQRHDPLTAFGVVKERRFAVGMESESSPPRRAPCRGRETAAAV